MRYTKEKEEVVVRKFSVSESSLYRWRAKGHIPDRYFYQNISSDQIDEIRKGFFEVGLRKGYIKLVSESTGIPYRTVANFFNKKVGTAYNKQALYRESREIIRRMKDICNITT